LVKVILAKTGYSIEIANNGKEAFDIYTSTPEAFDMIFMDVQMPEMDGLASTEKIRTWEAAKTGCDPSYIRIPIIAMTANAMNEDREECLATGMDNYLSKPIKRETIYEMVEKYIGRNHEH
jgi:CheY-like chemotaxis protein